jgi:hypothetical protein
MYPLKLAKSSVLWIIELILQLIYVFKKVPPPEKREDPP